MKDLKTLRTAVQIVGGGIQLIWSKRLCCSGQLSSVKITMAHIRSTLSNLIESYFKPGGQLIYSAQIF